MSGYPFKDILHIAVRREPLSRELMQRAFQIILNDGATPAQIAAFLTALAMQPTTSEMLSGAAEVIRGRMHRISAPSGAIDTCGTGGDGTHGLNISTAVAFVVAACGVPVAKHGNRAISSRSGSADVLQSLGINIDIALEQIPSALEQAGVCFLMAPRFHPSLRVFADVRRDLGMRTLMNILGPLCNPAGVKHQLLGVYSPELLMPVAEALQALGAQSAWVVHGGDGSDELSLTQPSMVVALANGKLESFTITAADAGIEIADIAQAEQELRGGDATFNAEAITQLFAGKHSAFRSAVLLNAAAALCVAGVASNMTEAASMAATAIDSGEARARLAALAYASQPLTHTEHTA